MRSRGLPSLFSRAARGGKNTRGDKKNAESLSPVASRFVFHPNQLIPFMTTSFPVWSTMRPFLVVRKGAFEAAAGERAAAESFFYFRVFSKVGEKRGRRKERKELLLSPPSLIVCFSTPVEFNRYF